MTSKRKINYRFTITLLLVLLVFNFLPLVLLAEGPLVTCGTGEDGPTSCNWQELVKMFNKVIDFIFLDLMIPLAVLAIVWAGIQILLKKSQPADLLKEKGALRNVAIGIFMALGAYAIVKTILTLLPGNENGFLNDVIKQVFGS